MIYVVAYWIPIIGLSFRTRAHHEIDYLIVYQLALHETCQFYRSNQLIDPKLNFIPLRSLECPLNVVHFQEDQTGYRFCK